MPPTPPPDAYDAVIIGGAFSGAGFATLLRRLRPASRVLVVESSERFTRRVGEATVEVSAFFLQEVLRLSDYLAREHLPKHGLRFWFGDHAERPLEEMTEVGPRELPRLQSFQLDRSKLDEQLLATARAAGCDVMRPARVLEVEHGWPESRVRIDADGGERRVTARWVIDASGRHAFIARRRGLLRRVEGHPTAAAWARWTGVRDLDGVDVLGCDPRGSRLPPVAPARRLATNHFCGYGWWCWVIPLSGGETSVGVVYNKELFELPGNGPLRRRYADFVTSQCGLRELLEPATMVDDDFLAYRHLPYRSSRYMDRGWALVGDAAMFLDPFYSPGLDHASISTYATARLVERDLDGDLDDAALDAAVAEHNGNFERSYHRWLEALYLGKYELMGDAELLGCAFLVDTALYYLGVVTPVYRDVEALAHPFFGLDKPQTKYAHRFMRAFNRRLCRLARLRRQTGIYGRHNAGRRSFSRAFDVGPAAALGPLARGFRIWLRLEAEQLLARLRRGPRDASEPVPTEKSPLAPLSLKGGIGKIGS